MPTYEYECPSCEDVVEAFQSMRDAPLTNCPRCGQPGVKRLIGRGAGIIFKGSGFYETDYRRTTAKKDGGDTAPSAPASGASGGSGGASAPAAGGNSGSSAAPKSTAS
ncbi:MAG: zinc ribbon domain-containing protein [Opitutaceae bacterium]|nr:zinc ribbon domain-containing protein [Opitutaceae bacterium]